VGAGRQRRGDGVTTDEAVGARDRDLHLLLTRSSTTRAGTVKPLAGRQDGDHHRPADRAEKAQDLGFLPSREEDRIDPQEGGEEPRATEEEKLRRVGATLRRPPSDTPPGR